MGDYDRWTSQSQQQEIGTAARRALSVGVDELRSVNDFGCDLLTEGLGGKVSPQAWRCSANSRATRSAAKRDRLTEFHCVGTYRNEV